VDILRRIERIEEDVAEIKGCLNDISHTVARVEEDIKWIIRMIKWLFGVIGFLVGLILTMF